MLDTSTATAVTARSWEAALTALRGLAEADWSRPTRLAGWAVRDLVAHNVWGVSMETDAVRRARSGQDGRAEGVSVDPSDPAALTEALSQAVTDLVFELSTSTGEDEDRTVPLAAADVPWPLAVTIFAMEAAVHADDLAMALGTATGAARPELEPDAVHATVAFLEWFLPLMVPIGEPPAAGSVVRFAGDGGQADFALGWTDGAWSAKAAATATVTIAGSDSDVVRVALGRLPVDDPALRLSGDTAAAGSVKSWLPGP